MRTRRAILESCAASLCALWGATASAQLFGKKDKKKEKPTRSVKGEVTDENEDILVAIVQLKNLSSQDVRSYHAPQGVYYFHGLDPNVDYEITAKAKGFKDKTRRVSTFESRMDLFYAFKLKSE